MYSWTILLGAAGMEQSAELRAWSWIRVFNAQCTVFSLNALKRGGWSWDFNAESDHISQCSFWAGLGKLSTNQSPRSAALSARRILAMRSMQCRNLEDPPKNTFHERIEFYQCATAITSLHWVHPRELNVLSIEFWVHDHALKHAQPFSPGRTIIQHIIYNWELSWRERTVKAGRISIRPI